MEQMNPFEELKDITNNAMLAVEEDDPSVDVMNVIQTSCERAIELAEVGLSARDEKLVESCNKACTFLKDLAKTYEQKTYSAILEHIGSRPTT